MLRPLRYRFWLHCADLVERLSLPEALRLWLVIRAAQLIAYDDGQSCENCDARVVGSWSEARQLGWLCATGPDSDWHTLCPECQEPAERIHPWT